MSEALAVSVVIPVRNGLPDVIDAIQSALDQTLPPREIIVIEDDSKDGSGDVIAQRFGDRVTLIRGHHGSAAAARNAGWQAASSPWIALLDADDLWFRDKLAVAAERLAAHPEAQWFFSDGAFRTLDGIMHRSWLELYADVAEDYVGRPVGELCDVNFVLTSSVIVRRDLLEAEGGFDESMSHAEDLDLWIRLARRASAVASNRPLVRYQHREGGLTRQIEARLMGDVVLFRKLGRDTRLAPELRARARRREALAHYKLAIEFLRDQRRGEARSRLRQAWRAGMSRRAVLMAWGASLMPHRMLQGLRQQSWATRGVGVRLLRSPRPSMEPDARPAAERAESS